MDPAVRKKALRMLSYGLCVATSQDEIGPAAGTINWISQSSFSPPLVMVAFKVDSRLQNAVTATGAFTVHVLGRNQKEMAMAFFKGAQPEGNTLNGFRVEKAENGTPLLMDPPAWFECRVMKEVLGGDHTVFVAEITAAGVRRDAEPLSLREAGFSYGG